MDINSPARFERDGIREPGPMKARLLAQQSQFAGQDLIGRLEPVPVDSGGQLCTIEPGPMKARLLPQQGQFAGQSLIGRLLMQQV